MQTVAPPTSETTIARPIFVDESGRRSRRARWVLRGLGALLVLYLVMVGAGLAGAPWVPKIALPGVGQVLTTPDGPRPQLGPQAVASPPPAQVTAGRSRASEGDVPTTVAGGSTPAPHGPATPASPTPAAAAPGAATPSPPTTHGASGGHSGSRRSTPTTAAPTTTVPEHGGTHRH